MEQHFRYMGAAVRVALAALFCNEVPVGVVLVHREHGVVGAAHNDTNRLLNGTRHAEFVAMDQVYARFGRVGKDWWADVTVYVTVEPCVMCASALDQTGVGRVVFGCANDRFGGNGLVMRFGTYEVVPGVMRLEAVCLLRGFYLQENPSAPVPKVKAVKEESGFPPMRWGDYGAEEPATGELAPGEGGYDAMEWLMEVEGFALTEEELGKVAEVLGPARAITEEPASKRRRVE